LKRFHLILSCFFLFVFANNLLAQDDSTADANAVKDQEVNLLMPKDIKIADYGFDLRLAGFVPNPMTNKALKESFIGVYGASAIFDANIYKGFFVGGGFQNELLSTVNNQAATFIMYMQVDNAVGRMGYLQQVGDIVFFSYALDAGWNFTKFTSVVVPTGFQPKNKYTYTNAFVGAETTLFLLLQDHFAIGLNLTLDVMDKTFDPSFVYLDQFRSYNNSDKKGMTSYLNLGFGLYYGFHKRKK